MATKKKKKTPKRQSISSGRPRSYGEMYKNETSRQQSTPVAASTTTGVTNPTTTATTVEWRTEYSHVLRDLKTLLSVSAVLFIVIIIAGFFI